VAAIGYGLCRSWGSGLRVYMFAWEVCADIGFGIGSRVSVCGSGSCACNLCMCWGLGVAGLGAVFLRE
jgi:hypothetical protein